jgi:hypothetical protein
MGETVSCPACGLTAADLGALASHLVEQAEASDVGHVMWLNRHVTKHRTSPARLEPELAAVLAGENPSGDRIKR